MCKFTHHMYVCLERWGWWRVRTTTFKMEIFSTTTKIGLSQLAMEIRNMKWNMWESFFLQKRLQMENGEHSSFRKACQFGWIFWKCFKTPLTPTPLGPLPIFYILNLMFWHHFTVKYSFNIKYNLQYTIL